MSQAAKALGLSQPALSAALRRLRRHFGDDLLVRVGNTYRLTPLAVSLRARVSLAIEGAERFFDARPEFDPALCGREFTIVTSDYALSVAKIPWVTALDQRTTYTPVHKQLQLLGAALNIEVITDGFLAVPALVAATSRVALIQQRVARTLPPELGIRVFECPFDALPLVEALWWHPLYSDDPEHQLLRLAFSDVAAALAEPSEMGSVSRGDDGEAATLRQAGKETARP